MDGVGGKPAWAWIFILEGLLTVLAGVASFWIIQDFPDTAKFLSEAERTVVIRRLQDDDQYSAGGEELRWKYIWQSIFDWKTWLGSKSSFVILLIRSEKDRKSTRLNSSHSGESRMPSSA